MTMENIAEIKDKLLTCKTCQKDFEWSAKEQRYYAKKGFKKQPQKCSDCRSKANKLRNEQMFYIHCAFCDKDAAMITPPPKDRVSICEACYNDFIKKAESGELIEQVRADKTTGQPEESSEASSETETEEKSTNQTVNSEAQSASQAPENQTEPIHTSQIETSDETGDALAPNSSNVIETQNIPHNKEDLEDKIEEIKPLD